jgi:hypothetical protein
MDSNHHEMSVYPHGERGEIILYQPDSSLKLEVRLENETVWLTQAQIADLFGTKRPAITKHLSNIYKTGELEENSTCSILEHMGNDGKQIYQSIIYNPLYFYQYQLFTKHNSFGSTFSCLIFLCMF